MLRRLFWALVILVLLSLAIFYVLGTGVLGKHWGVNPVNEVTVPPKLVGWRTLDQKRAARQLGVREAKQVLFGDLHVHSTFSTDAFMAALPSAGGEGAHPVSDACDFARYCSALDFWSINDHALALTPQRWEETKQAVRQCNAVASSKRNPDTVAFLGWEWTNVGASAEDHWGHKNVVLRDLDEDSIPARPITTGMLPDVVEPTTVALGLMALSEGFQQTTWDTIRYMRETAPPCEAGIAVRDLPRDCMETAATPHELFTKLDDWGHESIVIPHGTSWGFYTPAGASWDKQLDAPYHDPKRQFMVEVYSGHGNSEEYKAFSAISIDAAGNITCPAASPGFLPSCQRAGQIILERCERAGLDASVCQQRQLAAQRHYVDSDLMGFLTVPGATPNDWLDAGQCRECFQPAFNYRPRSSVQYMLALGRSAAEAGTDDVEQRRFRFGLMAASDNHTARPGTGYKEYARTEMTEARFGKFVDGLLGGRIEAEALPESQAFDIKNHPRMQFFGLKETERQGSFFYSGGLIAVHSEGRSRGKIWDAMQRKEIYGTSGPRILLWFDLVLDDQRLPMGGETTTNANPVFQVRALGSLEQNPGCPDYSRAALTPERLHYLCRNECYNPGNKRRPISRIEVVRIKPQTHSGESIDPLIEDPWRVFDCANGEKGCEVSFTDQEFAEHGRDTVYYARAIEAPSEAINAATVRCEHNEKGECVQANICNSDDPAEDCLAETEQRAWSSPIFVDFGQP